MLNNTRNFLVALATISIAIFSCNAVKVVMKDRMLYQIIPQTEAQLDFFAGIGKTNPEMMLLSGIGGLNETIEILAKEEDMDELHKNNLSSLGIQKVEPLFQNVKITMDDKQTESIQCPNVPEFPPTKIHSSKFSVPIQKIPGSSLYTGIYYRIQMIKLFPFGVVTLTNAEDGNYAQYLQIDLNPKNLPHYFKGAKWYKDSQFMFVPSTNTENAGWYTLINRVASDEHSGLLTWNYQQVGGGYHIVSSKNPGVLSSLKTDEQDSALWKVEEEEPGLYKLRLKAHPQGTVTWTEKKYGEHSHYLQIDVATDRYEHYRKDGKWFNDTLFAFQPSDLALKAHLSNFTFANINSFNFKNATTINQTNVKTLINRSDRKIERSVDVDSTRSFTARFEAEQSLSFNLFEYLDEIYVSFEIPQIFLNVNNQALQKGFWQSTKYELSRSLVYKIGENVVIGPHSTKTIYEEIESLEAVEFDWEAEAIIWGETEGRSKNWGKEGKDAIVLVPGKMVKDKLSEKNINVEVQIGERENEVKMVVKGKMSLKLENPNLRIGPDLKLEKVVDMRA